MKPGRRGGLVYSTELGRTCPTCRRPLAACACPAEPEVPRGDGIVRVARETKGRKGAGVTLVRGLPGDEALLKELAKRLKAACGVGGAVKEGVIELQGEQRQKIKPLLEAAGYVVKIAGG